MTSAPRSVLFVPANRPRMVAKAADLPADLIVLDLEDAIRAEDKASTRAGIAQAVRAFAGRPVAIRVNAADTDGHREDLAAVADSDATCVVLPKVEDTGDLSALSALGKPVVAMIETPRGVLHAAKIAREAQVLGLMAGTNDLAALLRLPPAMPRAGMATALQTIVLAARAAGRWAIDGVCNVLDDAERFERECEEGRTFGFDGKSLIHPSQIDTANRLFAPSAAELEDAAALVGAAGGGAERFRGRMIEDLHVAAARALLERGRA